MFATGLHPDEIIHQKDLEQISDSDELSQAVAQVVADNPKAVEDYKAGKEASLKFLIGKIMAATKGKANPHMVEELLRKKLK